MTRHYDMSNRPAVFDGKRRWKDGAIARTSKGRKRRRSGGPKMKYGENAGHFYGCEGIARDATAWNHDDLANEWVCRFCGARKFHVPPGKRKYIDCVYFRCVITRSLARSVNRCRELCGGLSARAYGVKALELLNIAVLQQHQEQERAKRAR